MNSVLLHSLFPEAKKTAGINPRAFLSCASATAAVLTAAATTVIAAAVTAESVTVIAAAAH